MSAARFEERAYATVNQQLPRELVGEKLMAVYASVILNWVVSDMSEETKKAVFQGHDLTAPATAQTKDWLEWHLTRLERKIAWVRKLASLPEAEQPEWLRNRLRDKPLHLLASGFGLAGEGGEFLKTVAGPMLFLKKKHVVLWKRLWLELGDVHWYAAYAAHELGRPTPWVWWQVVRKLWIRHRGRFSPQQSVARVDVEKGENPK
jgi:hypothetical protein